MLFCTERTVFFNEAVRS